MQGLIQICGASSLNNWKIVKKKNSSDWCGSVGWASAHKEKGRWFDFQSGHVPGLRARSPVGGVREATYWCFSYTSKFASISFSLPYRLSKNIKSFKKEKKELKI